VVRIFKDEREIEGLSINYLFRCMMMNVELKKNISNSVREV